MALQLGEAPCILGLRKHEAIVELKTLLIPSGVQVGLRLAILQVVRELYRALSIEEVPVERDRTVLLSQLQHLEQVLQRLDCLRLCAELLEPLSDTRIS